MKYRSIALNLISVTHGWNDFLAIVIFPLLPLLISEFNLSYFEAGSVVFVFRATSAFLQPFVGYFGDRTGKKKLLLAIGIVCLSAALFLTGTANSYIVLLVAAFAVGLGAAVYHPLGVSMLGDLFKNKRGFVLGIHGAAGGIGVFIAPLVATYFAMIWGWRPFLMILIIPTGILAVLIIALLRDLKAKSVTKPVLSGLANIRIILLMFIAFLITMCTSVMLTFVPIFFVQGMSLSIFTAGLFTSIMLSTFIFSQPICGRIYDRLNSFRREMFALLIFGWGVCWFLYTVTPLPMSVIFITLGAFSISATWPILFELTLRVAPKGVDSTAVGLVTGLTMVGSVSSMIFGGIADLHGLAFSLPFAAVLAGLAGLLCFFLPRNLEEQNQFN